MTKRKLALVIGVLALVTILGVVSVGAALAQTGTPTTPTTPSQPNATQPNMTQPDTGKLERGFGFGFRGGDTTTFDAVANALNLDPTELFKQLHEGKSLSDIATAQGKTMADIQAALNVDRVKALKDKIAAAVTAGTISQDEAAWLQQGLDKGYYFGGRGFGFGFEGRGRGHGGAGFGGMMPGGMMPGMRGFGKGGFGSQQQPTPSTSSLGTSS